MNVFEEEITHNNTQWNSMKRIQNGIIGDEETNGTNNKRDVVINSSMQIT